MPVSVSSEYLNVPGGFINLETYDGGGSGIPLLYVHGGPGGNCESFRPMAERLAETRKVYLYNQLGSDEAGHTGEESLWSIDRYMEALGQVISSLKVEKLHLLGRSWGGMLAAEHVLSVKDSPVVSITAMSPFFSTRLWLADAKKRLAEMGGEYLHTVVESESSIYFDGAAYRDTVRAYNLRYQCREDEIARLGPRFSKAVQPKSPAGMKVYRYMWGPGEFTCTGVLREMDITGRLPQIKLRVLFLCGEYDQVLPKTCEYYRSLIPGSRMAIIPNASQTQFLENPDLFYNTLMQFLRGF